MQETPSSPLRAQRLSPLRALVIIVGSAGLIAAIAYGLWKPAPGVLQPGDAAPDFELPLLAAEGSLSSADLRGKAVVLNFWASYCWSCREEARVLDRAWRKHRDEGLIVLGVNVRRDSETNATTFADTFGMSFPLVRDVRGDLAESFGINDRALPQTFFITKDGTLADVFAGRFLTNESGTTVLGPLTERALNEQLRRLLGGT